MTTQTTMPPETTAAEPRRGGPGAQLRQARVDLKLEPEDVARILHLSPRQIVALENNDYTNLSGPTYVRGYLRGYAQLLGLAVEPVMEAYNSSVTTRKPVDLGKLAPKQEIRSDHQLVKFATVGVVAIILGLSAVWWQEKEEPVAPVSIRDAVAPATESGEPARLEPSEDESRGETMSPSVSARENKVTVPAAVSSPVPKAVPAPAVPAPTPPQDRSPSPAAAPSSSSMPPVSADGASPVAPHPTLITGPRGRLIVRTTLESWADVRDANGERLIYEIIPAGRTVTLEGVLPISVFLGNSDGVHVEFNGKTVDLAPYRRGDIARFTLKEPAGTP